MLRCVELGLSSEDTTQYTMGMVYDMLTEKGNDDEEYAYQPMQSDFDNL